MWHSNLFPRLTSTTNSIFLKGNINKTLLETEVALITHLKVDLYLRTPTHSVVDNFIISNYLVLFGPFWLQGRPSNSRVAEPTYRWSLLPGSRANLQMKLGPLWSRGQSQPSIDHSFTHSPSTTTPTLSNACGFYVLLPLRLLGEGERGGSHIYRPWWHIWWWHVSPTPQPF
jgi:hypothetical protein